MACNNVRCLNRNSVDAKIRNHREMRFKINSDSPMGDT